MEAMTAKIIVTDPVAQDGVDLIVSRTEIKDTRFWLNISILEIRVDTVNPYLLEQIYVFPVVIIRAGGNSEKEIATGLLE